jgi:hypothetical protein
VKQVSRQPAGARLALANRRLTADIWIRILLSLRLCRTSSLLIASARWFETDMFICFAAQRIIQAFLAELFITNAVHAVA